jgi:amino acid transporter
MAFVATGTFTYLLAITAFFYVLNYAIAFAALFALRRQEPDLPRPFRAWGYPWSTGIVLVGLGRVPWSASWRGTAQQLYALACWCRVIRRICLVRPPATR